MKKILLSFLILTFTSLYASTINYQVGYSILGNGSKYEQVDANNVYNLIDEKELFLGISYSFDSKFEMTTSLVIGLSTIENYSYNNNEDVYSGGADFGIYYHIVDTFSNKLKINIGTSVGLKIYENLALSENPTVTTNEYGSYEDTETTKANSYLEPSVTIEYSRISIALGYRIGTIGNQSTLKGVIKF